MNETQQGYSINKEISDGLEARDLTFPTKMMNVRQRGNITNQEMSEGENYVIPSHVKRDCERDRIDHFQRPSETVIEFVDTIISSQGALGLELANEGIVNTVLENLLPCHRAFCPLSLTPCTLDELRTLAMEVQTRMAAQHEFQNVQTVCENVSPLNCEWDVVCGQPSKLERDMNSLPSPSSDCIIDRLQMTGNLCGIVGRRAYPRMNPQPTCVVQLSYGGVLYPALLDTGATHCVTSWSFIKRLLRIKVISRFRVRQYIELKMCIANGNITSATHVVDFHFKIGHFAWNFQFWILPNLNHQLIFSLEFLERPCAAINLNDFTLYFGFAPTIKIHLDRGKVSRFENKHIEVAVPVLDSVYEKLEQLKHKFSDVINSKIGICDVLPY
ncbi:hypothetical protein PR048_031892 [Dryococelus australis]|uniref:Peptidase A2 domain-containing protein n=1 Tax=Dryococelus australis TaxID=614101 RepID=A0ABQ9G768_9NEOP|nr:hypothetical protein PR048_031892 [Dryococelus australis]